MSSEPAPVIDSVADVRDCEPAALTGNHRLVVYGIIGRQANGGELFARREDAERIIADIRADDPELAAELRLEPVLLDAYERLP